MVRILYVHGYNGNPYGGSFQKISAYAAQADFGGERVEMHTFDYDASEPGRAIHDLRVYYFKHDIDLMIGSSLGGFLVMNCHWARRIVINPCWSPSVELPKVGYEGPVNEYQFREERLGSYSNEGDGELCIGCFARNDELLGRKYLRRFRKFYKETYDIPGGHHLSEEAARLIMTKIAPELFARFKSCKGPGHIVRRGLSLFERIHYAHILSIHNRSEIMASSQCGCFSCCRMFPASEVVDFIDERNGDPTAMCPYCMIDSVFGDASGLEIKPGFLAKLQNYWF